jgi:catechol 1,2-dioxygenase
MGSNGVPQPVSNGMTNGSTKFDPDFTRHVIENIGPACPDRPRFVLSSLIKHLHDFVRETELTPDEWMTGVKFINSIGQISDSKRNEGQRICDVLGIESYVCSCGC